MSNRNSCSASDFVACSAVKDCALLRCRVRPLYADTAGRRCVEGSGSCTILTAGETTMLSPSTNRSHGKGLEGLVRAISHAGRDGPLRDYCNWREASRRGRHASRRRICIQYWRMTSTTTGVSLYALRRNALAWSLPGWSSSGRPGSSRPCTKIAVADRG